MNATNDFVDIRYQQNGQSTTTNSLGMREMQAKAYEARTKKYLLIKAPPASGKSRALMFIALDKLEHQGIRKITIRIFCSFEKKVLPLPLLFGNESVLLNFCSAMNKKYDMPDFEPQMANEPTVMYRNHISQLDALWALILNQAEDIQIALEERLRRLLAKEDGTTDCYTIEELHNRIALSEKEFETGQYSTHAEVSKQIDELFESWN